MTRKVPGRSGDSTKALGEKEKDTWSNTPKETNVPVKTLRSRLGDQETREWVCPKCRNFKICSCKENLRSSPQWLLETVQDMLVDAIYIEIQS